MSRPSPDHDGPGPSWIPGPLGPGPGRSHAPAESVTLLEISNSSIFVHSQLVLNFFSLYNIAYPEPKKVSLKNNTTSIVFEELEE